MKISFEGIGEVVSTFLVEQDSGVKPGDVVCMTGNETVGLGEAGMAPCGVATTVAGDGCVGVQIGGLAEVAYSGTAPTVGWNMLTADGQGGVSTVSSAAVAAVSNDNDSEKGNDSKEDESASEATANGVSFLVVSVDTTNETAVVKL